MKRPHLGQVGVGHWVADGGLGGEVRTQCLEVRRAQVLDHGLHGGALALARAVVGQLARHIGRVLAGQPRKHRAGAFALCAVADEALALHDLFGPGRVGQHRQGGQLQQQRQYQLARPCARVAEAVVAVDVGGASGWMHGRDPRVVRRTGRHRSCARCRAAPAGPAIRVAGWRGRGRWVERRGGRSAGRSAPRRPTWCTA